MAPQNTPIDTSKIVWDDAPKAIDPAQVQWDAPAPQMPSYGDVALNAIPKTFANLFSTPITIWNLAKDAAGAMHPQIKDYLQPTPNYPMQAAESLGLVDPAKNPQTTGQRIMDMAIQGGIGTALSPASSVTGLLKNIGTGLVGGGAAQSTKELMDKNQIPGGDVAATAVGMATPWLLRSTANPAASEQNAVRDQTLREAQSAGYKVPASTINPTTFTNTVESIAGKAATKQALELKNQQVTNALVDRELGLPANTPVTPGVLKQYQQQWNGPYKEVAALSPRANAALEKMNEARSDANGYWTEYRGPNHPYDVLKKAQAADAKANAYERVISKEAQRSGRPELVDALAEARMQKAKGYDVEWAMNAGDANIDAKVIGSMYDKNPDKFTGNLKVIGAFEQGPGRQFTRESASVPSPGVSAVGPLSSVGFGMGGAGLYGGPGWLAAGIPYVRGPVRSFATSDLYQRLFAQPDYSGLSQGEKALQSAILANELAARQQGVQR